MSLRTALRAGALASAGFLMVAGVGPAAASSPSWRIVQVFGAPDFPNMQGLATSGAANAWMAGGDASSLVVKRWDGSQWQPVTPPSGFANTTASINCFVAGTSGPGNTWFFPSRDSTYYGLRWDGSAWTKFRLSSTNQVLGTAVFSRTNIWEFGAKPGSGLGFGPAWVLRFNGSTWRQVSVPGTPVNVSPAAASDIWALGPTAATVNNNRQVIIAMHWNGRSWRSISLPGLTPVSGHAWVPVAVLGQGPASAWVEEIPAATPGGGSPPPPGLWLLHWNGSAWTKVLHDGTHNYSPDLASDGNSGLWLTGFNSTTLAYSFVHFAGGLLTRTAVPSQAGFVASAGDLSLIPGTISLWALGSLTPTGPGSTESDILKFGN